MGFTEAVSTCFSKYATFSGRALRSEYWFFYLFNILGSIVLSIVDSILFGMGGGLLGGLFSLAMIIPSIAAGTRRLHDTGRSGWWQLLWFIPVIGWILLIVWLASEGSAQENAYGPHPGNDDGYDDGDDGVGRSSIPTVSRD